MIWVLHLVNCMGMGIKVVTCQKPQAVGMGHGFLYLQLRTTKALLNDFSGNIFLQGSPESDSVSLKTSKNTLGGIFPCYFRDRKNFGPNHQYCIQLFTTSHDLYFHRVLFPESLSTCHCNTFGWWISSSTQCILLNFFILVYSHTSYEDI